MANISTTTIDSGTVAHDGAEFRDELLTLPGAQTVLAGTILARDSVSGKLVPYVDTGTPTNENNVPKAVLTYEVTSTGAGDVPVRALVAGKVNKHRLVIDADGAATVLTSLHLDQLRSYAIVPVDLEQLAS